MAGKYSALWLAIADRIKGHVKSGGILEGWKVESNPAKEITGTADLPSARFMPPTFEEQARQLSISDGTFKMRIDVFSDRAVAVEVHLADVEKVMDALNVEHTTGETDVLISGTAQEAPTFSAGEGTASDVSISTRLTVTIKPRTCLLGARRL